MKLKSLTLNGFKSFADKTKIDFQTGMTGIVGPNGSGKSNIIEALRWVLGEQSAKSLRGGKMPDVIFAGSQTRAPLNHAEVELEFDNADRFLEIDDDQVTITRKIYRNGDSDFLINNKSVRLRDIVELFMDTGLGKESFSIISQGRVEAIFNSKPQERRALIEEVAGVVKYKKEKQKATQELAETTDHLDRVADIITELRKQREPLEKQASIAKDYIVQKEEFDRYEKSRLVLEIDEQLNIKNELEQKATQLEQVLQKHTVLSNEQEQHVQNSTKLQSDLTAQIDQAQQELNILTAQREKLLSRQDISKHDAALFKERLAEFEENIANDEQLVLELTSQLEQVTSEKKEADKLKQTYTSKIDTLQKALLDDPATIASQIEDIRQELIDLMQAEVSAKNELVYLDQENERTVAQRQAESKRYETTKDELEQLSKQQAEVLTEAKKADDAYQELKTKRTELQKKSQDLQRLREDQQRRWLKASEILQKAKAQHNSLKNIMNNYSGYYHGAKEILQADLSGVVSSVAQQIRVPSQVAKAIDVALGAQLQNIIVTDEQAAKEAIVYLNKKRAGRATFLPRTTVRPRYLRQEQLNALQQVEGVVGVAKDLVEYDPSDSPIVTHLLGAIVIANDLTSATKIANVLNHSVKIVTLNGEVINAGGSMTGGQDKEQRVGLLEQKQQVEKLATDINTMQEKLGEIEFEGGQSKNQIEELAKQLEELQPKEQEAQTKAQSFTKEIERCEIELKHKNSQLQLFEQTAATMTSDAKTYAKKRQSLEEKRSSLGQTIKEKRVELELRMALQKDKTQALKEQQTELTELKQKEAIANERLQMLTLRIKENQTQLQQAKARIEKTNAKINEITKNNQKTQLNDDELTEKTATVEKELIQVSSLIDKKKEKRDKVNEELKQAQQELSRANQLKQASLDEKGELKASLSKCKTILARELEELSNEYKTTYESAKAENTMTDLEFVKNRVRLLKLGIEELGEVNLGAISEFERIDTRYSFLTQQQNDLLEAKEQLVKSMEAMDIEAKNRFKEAFEQVAKAFSEIFPQVFEGGKATLSLTDPTNLLETGIEIMAQPPGKKFQHLNLLSGGERSLTAIVLLFAILKVRPVPFVVLDEAEAALDDANVLRYSRYLQHFNTQTQFIVITHRKGTMMNADILYGVTMQESGVSKMVSVSLDEIEAN